MEVGLLRYETGQRFSSLTSALSDHQAENKGHRVKVLEHRSEVIIELHGHSVKYTTCCVSVRLAA